jgi:DnaJ-domain-containing protein 1
MPALKKPGAGMSWLDFAFGLASQAAKKLRAEYRAGVEGQPSPSETQRPVGDRPRSAGPPWWEVLGVPRAASIDEITAGYRERIAKNHPDKVMHLSDRLRQVADQETRRINAAYEEGEIGQRLIRPLRWCV